MALIVETGAGLANANSYISMADTDSYFLERENAAWDATSKDKEALLIRATDYMQQAFHGLWKGYRATATQALDWPRRQVPLEDEFAWFSYIPETQVPVRVRHACAELALILVAQDDLAPVIERAQASVQVGEISVTYDPASPQTARFPAVQMLVAPYLKGSSTMVRLARV